jgi:Domain of unknown function (DUF4386)
MSSPNATTRLAGILYVVMGIPAWFSLMYVPQRLVVRGDAAATARNITAAESLYRLGILSEVVSQITFLFLALVLYDLFKDVDRRHARLLVTLVAVGVAIEIVNCVDLIAPLILLHGGDVLSAFTKPQLDALALGFLRLRGAGVNLVSVFWGLWLFPFGVLVVKSGLFPKLLGVLLIVACVAYVANSVAYIILPARPPVVSTAALTLGGIGEWATVLWFLVKGARVPLSQARPSYAS